MNLDLIDTQKLGRHCADEIRQAPENWLGDAEWVRSIRATSPDSNWGPPGSICSRIIHGFIETMPPFNRDPKLCTLENGFLEHHNRIILLGALCLDPDFHGTEIKLNFPWATSFRTHKSKPVEDGRSLVWDRLPVSKDDRTKILMRIKTALISTKKYREMCENVKFEFAGLTYTIEESDDPPSFSKSEYETLLVVEKLSKGGRLCTIQQIVVGFSPGKGYSDETVRKALLHLIKCGYVERPDGNRSGARLTNEGRRFLAEIRG